ncbi:hypothetical protein NXX78_00570 [Bacteroides fragilis]|nr:hypothetical protein [Bacteroides fragilis]
MASAIAGVIGGQGLL